MRCGLIPVTMAAVWPVFFCAELTLGRCVLVDFLRTSEVPSCLSSTMMSSNCSIEAQACITSSMSSSMFSASLKTGITIEAL